MKRDKKEANANPFSHHFVMEQLCCSKEKGFTEKDNSAMREAAPKETVFLLGLVTQRF